MANMMTDEEADALDELYTKTIPPIRTLPRASGLSGGPLTRQRELLRSLDEVAAKTQAIPAVPSLPCPERRRLSPLPDIRR
jgi:hypothetical protein